MSSLFEILIAIAAYLIVFFIRYKVREDTTRANVEAKLHTASRLAYNVVMAVEDMYKNNPELKQKMDKLSCAISLFTQQLEKLGINATKDEAELHIRAAYQDSPLSVKGK